jgi:cell division protein FtsI/penicillin-binding protein 2
MIIRGSHNSGWKNYQQVLQRDARKKHLLSKLPLLAFYSGCFLFLLAVVFYTVTWISGHLGQPGHRSSDYRQRPSGLPEELTDEDLSLALKDLSLGSRDLKDPVVLEKAGERFTIITSLDPAFQKYILRLLRRSRTLQAAAVVLSPTDGRILAMASYGKEGNDENLCLKADFPAASIFKIVSAAAALESAGFTPDQTIFFRGRKHTLYRRQLEEKRGRYVSETSFRKAFALSINSVFGKLGLHYLGQGLMSEYADRFLFNHDIPFDLPVAMSTIEFPDNDFGLAEIASGFNRKTLMSPLHVALLASAVANNGIIMAPRLITRIMREPDEILYQSRPALLTSPISRGTAKDLKLLMRDTVLYGTCRESFKQMRRKKVFRGVELGAKTGTINDEGDRVKYDWLAAYAFPRNKAKAICVAVLSVHGKILGMRANELGRYIIDYHVSSSL